MLPALLFALLAICSYQSQVYSYTYDYDYGQTNNDERIEHLNVDIQTLSERIASYTKVNQKSASPIFSASYIEKMKRDLLEKEAELSTIMHEHNPTPEPAHGEQYFFLEESIWDKHEGEKIGPPQLYENDEWKWDSDEQNYYREKHPDSKRRTVDIQVKIAKGEL